MMLVYIMLESYRFPGKSLRICCQRQKAALLWRHLWDGEFRKRLFSTISEQHFNQNVGEVAYSIYLVYIDL